MADKSSKDVTTLLADIRAGKTESRDKLVDRVYDELQQLAHQIMQKERHDHTLQPTALVNETLVRLLSGELLATAPDRAYFYAAAAQAMRRVLVDHARRRRVGKRGGNHNRVPLDDVLNLFEQQSVDVLALNEALEELARRKQRQSSVVVLRFFGGLTMDEIAAYLSVALGTVENDWRIARAWLRGQLSA